MASTAFPWYDMHTNIIERGISCKGCQVRVETSYGKITDRDRVFSVTSFLAHFHIAASAPTNGPNGRPPVAQLHHLGG